MSSLTKENVLHIAHLAAIELEEPEVATLQQDLSSILNYVDRLSELNTHGVVPTSHVHGVVNAFRDDVIKPSLSVDEALGNAPDSGNGGFRVPKII